MMKRRKGSMSRRYGAVIEPRYFGASLRSRRPSCRSTIIGTGSSPGSEAASRRRRPGREYQAWGLKVAFQPRISTFTDAGKGIKRDFQSPKLEALKLWLAVRLRTISRRVEGPNGHPDGRGGYCFARFVAFPR